MTGEVDLGPVAGPSLDGALCAVSVPASTANLGPGYDTFGAALGLRTTVTALPRDPDLPRVTTDVVGHAATREHAVPTGDDNLVWQGLLTACEEHGWPVPDVRLHVRTAVPLTSGLGSSSAAIVGGLAIARLLAGADASVPPPGGGSRTPEQQARLVGDRALVRTAVGIEGHPDNVAPAIHGGVVVATTGDDGELVVRLSPPPPTTRPVLLVPHGTSSTAEARAVVPDHLDRADVIAQVGRAGHVVGAMLGAWPADARVAGDRLHEPPRIAALGAGGELLEGLRRDGFHAWLSGAGPSIAVAVPATGGAVPARVAAAAASAGHAVLPLTWDRQGIRSCVPDGCGVAGIATCLDCPLGSVR